MNPPTVHPPSANYSHVARVGNTLYISGQVATDAQGSLVGRGDPEAQAEQCLKNLDAIVQHFGGTRENIMKLTTFVTNFGFRPAVSSVRDRFFGPPYPANTFLVISALASPDLLVEIEAIAVLDT